MKQVRNPEYRKELIIYIIVTVVIGAALLFVDYRCTIVVCVIGAALTVLHYIFARKRYRKIAELSASIDSILHGQQEVLISENNEGELSILNSEIHKMTVRLKEQTDLLTSDKIRLTEAIEDIFHQLRTPLTSMNLVVSLLTDESLTYERRLQLTHELKRQLERIQWLVETLLKMSKIDAGTALFRKEQVPLKELLNEATEPFLITLELKGVDLELSAGEGYLECDRSWTGEALANLLKNCMEHTPAGGHIKVSCEDTALSTNITIEDSGEGFSEADLPYVFERFYKGSNSSPGNIGIGLAFSRMIITAQNGTITAENSREGGARFRIKFYKSIV